MKRALHWLITIGGAVTVILTGHEGWAGWILFLGLLTVPDCDKC